MNLSVLIPVYHRVDPSVFAECLDSLFRQTLQASEIVIVKDGVLTAALDNVIGAWASKLPLKIVGYNLQHGVSYALNYGLLHCEYEYVARMDSDDICMPERFKAQMSYLSEHPEIDVLGSSLCEFYIDKSGRRIEHLRVFPERVEKGSKKLYRGTPIGHPTVVYKRDLVIKYKYALEADFNEDIDLWFRLLRDGYRLTSLKEPLLRFRLTDASFARRSREKAFGEFKVYWKYLYEQNGFSPSAVLLLARLVSRLIPACLNKRLYFSSIREWAIS